MRWQGQLLGVDDGSALPGMSSIRGLLRSVQVPEFPGVTLHEVRSRSALNAVPAGSPMPFRWTINPYRGCLHQCIYCLAGDTEVLMADGRRRTIAELRVGDEIVGYATSSRFRDKAAYDTSVETTVYVRNGGARRGVGSALYTALFDAIRDEDVHRAYAGIALPNDASMALHRRFGFVEVGTYREVGRKFGRYWDVTWLERPLP